MKTKTVNVFESDTDQGEIAQSTNVCHVEAGFMSFSICRLTKVKRENIMLTVCVPANFGLFRGRTIREPFGSRHCPPAPRLSHLLSQLFTRVFTNFFKLFSLKSPFWLLEVGTSGRTQVHAIPLGGAECPKIFGTSFPLHSGYISENYQTLND